MTFSEIYPKNISTSFNEWLILFWKLFENQKSKINENKRSHTNSNAKFATINIPLILFNMTLRFPTPPATKLFTGWPLRWRNLHKTLHRPLSHISSLSLGIFLVHEIIFVFFLLKNNFKWKKSKSKKCTKYQVMEK